MKQFYDLQPTSTNTSLKSASAWGPSPIVVENILKAADTECRILRHVIQSQKCFQQIRVNSVRMEICLN